MKSLLSVFLAVALCAVLFAQRRGGGGPVTLPEGNGKATVESACVDCHALNQVVNAGHDRQEWQTVVDMMINDGAKVPPDQVATMVDYLAKNFPEKPVPPAVIVTGGMKVNIKEWTVPTPGSRPHDPLYTPDDSLWYTGQMANVIGRLDLKTEKFTEYHIKVPESGPHGLTVDKEGNIWFTANFKAYIGKLYTKTGEFQEYKIPAEARDPHTPIFDQKGTLWFTVQGANMLGRLNTQTGEVKVVTSPTPRSNPYGMVVDSKGTPFFVEFGSNKVARVDPNTMEIHEYVLPDPAARPRRVAITPEDIIYYSDYGRGYLGRLDPATGKVTEWPSPGGPRSQPYGITIVKGAVWYSESNTKPNTLVRFDPATEKFQTWPIPSGGGVVRNMMTTKDNNIVMACSGVNKVALAEIQ